MSRWSAVLLATALLASVVGAPAKTEAASALTVCLDGNLPPWSADNGATGSGFDVAVAQAVAQALGRSLAVQWFASKLDEDASTTLAVNALLSDGKCELVGGYPLLRDALGKPGVTTARLPGFAGATPADRGRRVPLGTLVPSRPYHRAVLVILLGSGETKPVKSLADLEGMRLGVEEGTLADAILMTYADGKLVDRITHLVPGRSQLLAELERGAFDATLVELRRFDAWRAEHPNTRIHLSGYQYPIGFNIGFVGLSTEAPLINAVNQAIVKLSASNQLAALAKASGVTYAAPRGPDVLEHLTMRDLASH
jgi:ABC-type amino acid transport substrate-binding protein